MNAVKEKKEEKKKELTLEEATKRALIKRRVIVRATNESHDPDFRVSCKHPNGKGRYQVIGMCGVECDLLQIGIDILRDACYTKKSLHKDPVTGNVESISQKMSRFVVEIIQED